MEASLTCAVCLGLFEQPVTLPRCSHNFCKPCVKDCAVPELCTVPSSQFPTLTVPCPLCRIPSTVPGGMDFLPINTTLAELVRLLRAASGQGGSEAKGAEGQMPSSEDRSSAPCGDHPGREQQLYCKSCAVPCCGQCVSERHQGFCHSVNLLDMVYQEEKLSLFSNFKKLRELHEKLKQEILDEKDVEMSFKNEIIYLNLAFEQIQKALDLRKKQLLDEIELQKNATLKERKVWKQVKDHQRKTVECLIKDCENIVDEFEPQHFLQVACDLNRRIISSFDIMGRTADHREKKQKRGPNHVDLQPTLDAISTLQITGRGPDDLFTKRNEAANGDFSFKTITRTWNTGEYAHLLKYSPAQDQELDYIQGQVKKVNVRFASISAMPEYKATSWEELRLKYYENSITDINKNVFSVIGRRTSALVKVSDKYLNSRRCRSKKALLKRQDAIEGDSSVHFATNALNNFTFFARENENDKAKPLKDQSLTFPTVKENAASNAGNAPREKLPKCLQEHTTAMSSGRVNCKYLKKNNDSTSDNMSTPTPFNTNTNDRTFTFKTEITNGNRNFCSNLFVGETDVLASTKPHQNGEKSIKTKCTAFSSPTATGFTCSFTDDSSSNQTAFFTSNDAASIPSNTASVSVSCDHSEIPPEANEVTDMSASSAALEEFFDASSYIDSQSLDLEDILDF